MAYITLEEVRRHGGDAASVSREDRSGVTDDTIRAAIAATVAEIDRITGELFVGASGTTLRYSLRDSSPVLRLPRFRNPTAVERRLQATGDYTTIARMDGDYEQWTPEGASGVPNSGYSFYLRRLRAPLWEAGNYRVTADWGYAAADVPPQIKWAALSQTNWLMLHSNSTGGVAGTLDGGIQLGPMYWHPQAYQIVTHWVSGRRAGGRSV